MTRGAGRVLPLGAMAWALAGCAETGVVRIIDGREIEGRFISEEAYALYGHAAYDAAWLEAGEKGLAPETEVANRAGATRAALGALTAAAEEDPGSALLWTRIGALRCGTAAGAVEQAREAFAKAEAIDPAFAPLWRETARCRKIEAAITADPAAAQARRREAIEAAEKAAALDPEDLGAASLEVSLLLAEDRREEAGRIARALPIRRPGSAEAWMALYAFARATSDGVLAERAAARARELLPRLGAKLESEVPALGALAELDAALGRDDLEEARKQAHRAKLSLGELALRAAALGRVKAARAEAEVVLGADPGDTSARIALAVAADLGGDLAGVGRAMSEVPAGSGAVTALGKLLLAEVLDRRAGAEAARAWLGAGGSGGGREAGSGDALLDAVAARVKARFGGGGGAAAVSAR